MTLFGNVPSRTLQRRRFLQAAGIGLLTVVRLARSARLTPVEIHAALSELERRSGGRLGVAMLGFGLQTAAGHRTDERFGMCSTFKLPLAAFVLRDIQEGRLEADTAIHYSTDDLVPYAPVTEQFLERGYMSVTALAEAAQTTSDNVAANLLLRQIGGPAGLTKRLRAIGDEVTRLDRYEPELNLVPPGELRDTTTPAAMAATVRRLLEGQVLSEHYRDILVGWMKKTTTGRNRLRAGFPSNWQVGNKTGTGIAAGMPNKTNDVAVAWPDDGSPALVVAAYYESDGSYGRMRREDAEVLRVAAEIVAQLDVDSHGAE